MNRSPLSVNASQLFNNWGNPTKVSPTEAVGSGVGVSDSSLSSLALSSSSTWAYNPTATTLSNSFGSEKGNGSSSAASKTWSSFGENNDSLWSPGPGTTVGGLPSGSGSSATKPRGPPPPGLSELRGQQQQATGDGSDVNPASVQSLMCLLNNLLVGGSGPSDNQQE